MGSLRIIFAGAFALAAAAASHAAGTWDGMTGDGVATGGKDGTYSGKLELGYLATTGNTQTSSLNAKASLGWEGARWRHGVSLGVVRATESGAVKTERYQASEKSDYKFNDTDYLFVAFSYDRDTFAGYDRRTSESVGYGRRLLPGPVHQLDLEAGVGARQNDPTLGPAEHDAIVRLGANYHWKFSEAGEFTQSAIAELGRDNRYVESVTALKAALTGRLGLKVSYTVKHNTDVLPGKVGTDTSTAVGVEYAF